MILNHTRLPGLPQATSCRSDLLSKRLPVAECLARNHRPGADQPGALDEYLAEQEGAYDGDTRWALAWFEQYGHEQDPYGVAETLSKAKNTSVEGLAQAGFLEVRDGKVHLLRRDELLPPRPFKWERGRG